MSYTKKTLIASLLKIGRDIELDTDEATKTLNLDTKEGEAEFSRMIEDNLTEIRQARNEFLSPIFGGKKVSSHCGYDMTVFCQSEDEVKETIQFAESMGFRNISTYVPQVSDGTKHGSMDDPDNAFAVDIRSSEEQIISENGERIIAFLAPVLKSFQEKIIYTYAYNTQASFTFRDEAAAQEMLNSINDRIENVKKITKSAFDASIQLEKERLDNFNIQIMFS
jgi:hypothetical protein